MLIKKCLLPMMQNILIEPHKMFSCRCWICANENKKQMIKWHHFHIAVDIIISSLVEWWKVKMQKLRSSPYTPFPIKILCNLFYNQIHSFLTNFVVRGYRTQHMVYYDNSSQANVPSSLKIKEKFVIHVQTKLLHSS